MTAVARKYFASFIILGNVSSGDTRERERERERDARIPKARPLYINTRINTYARAITKIVENDEKDRKKERKRKRELMKLVHGGRGSAKNVSMDVTPIFSPLFFLSLL